MGKKHSRFAASSAERWVRCSGSVALSDGVEQVDSPASIEGTKAHDLLELIMKDEPFKKSDYPSEMRAHVGQVAAAMNKEARRLKNADEFIETEVSLSFIDPEMFGTLDHGLAEPFGELVIEDLKYGKGHAVSAEGNLQMIYYAIGIAKKYNWDFEKVTLRIYQPRGKGKTVKEWTCDVKVLKDHVTYFGKAVRRIKTGNTNLFEGSWCYFCPGKKVCPLKRKKFEDKVMSLFKAR